MLLRELSAITTSEVPPSGNLTSENRTLPESLTVEDSQTVDSVGKRARQ